MDDVNSVRPLSKRRFLQFRLRSLFILPVLVALGCFWYLQYRKAKSANEGYEFSAAVYEMGAGEVTAIDLCNASLRLCEAEEGVPFAGSLRARERHHARIREIETRERARIQFTMFGSEEGRTKALEELDRIGEYYQDGAGHGADAPRR